MKSPLPIRAQPGDIAPVVLLPGDPGRAERVAERLDGARCYNQFRGLLGYTGRYKGSPVSVQTTAMGAPSAAIVVEELALLGARTVIRIGTCGGTGGDVRPKDLVIAPAACPSRTMAAHPRIPTSVSRFRAVMRLGLSSASAQRSSPKRLPASAPRLDTLATAASTSACSRAVELGSTRT